MKVPLLLLLSISLNSCTLTCMFVEYLIMDKTPPKQLINQKEDCIWVGSQNNHYYILTITNSETHRFDGKMIIDDSLVLDLKGYEKGSCHPTSYKGTENDSSYMGRIFFWTIGLNADSVEIENRIQNQTLLIPDKLVLLKKYKNCL